jgi:hypothetical protein
MSGVFPHAIVVDVDLMTSVQPASVRLVGQDGLGAVANKLGPVLVWAEGKQELLDWALSANGQAWLREIKACGNTFYPVLGDDPDYTQVLDKCGVKWGKTIFTRRAELEKWGGDAGYRVYTSFDDFGVCNGANWRKRGRLGEAGAESWREVLSDLDSRLLNCIGSQFGRSLVIHDFHCVTTIDIVHFFSEQKKGGARVILNLVDIIRAIRAASEISDVMVSFHLHHLMRLQQKFESTWSNWEKGGWLKWVVPPRFKANSRPDETCNVSFKLTSAGLAQLQFEFAKSLRESGVEDVELHLLGLNVKNKEDAHPRFLFTEFLHGCVDPSWSLFHSKKKGGWKCEFGSSLESLSEDETVPSDSKEIWEFYINELRHAFLRNSGHIAVDGEGGVYSDSHGWDGFPFLMWDYIIGMQMNKTAVDANLPADSND